MKKTLYIIIFSTLLACTNKDVIKGTAVSFYPSLVDQVVEGGLSSASLELTGPGTGTVVIRVSDPEFITTDPAMVDGSITLEFGEADDSKEIKIEVGRGNRTEDYKVDFEVVSVSGDISGIASGTFSLFITAIPSLELPFLDDFESCDAEFTVPEKWIEEFVSGSKTDRGWGCRATDGVNGTSGMRASAFGGESGTDNAWLITKGSIDLSTVPTAFISFDMKSNFAGDGELIVWWSENYSGAGDPTAATWTEIPGVASQLPVPGSGNYQTVSAELTSLLGKKVFIGFQYVGGTNSSSASYEMDNFSVAEEGVSTDFFSIPFTDDLNNCSDFSIPANFTQQIIPGAKQDRGWECSANGVASSQGVSVNALGGVAGTADAWLISAKPFDLTATNKATLALDIQSRTAGSGNLKILWSKDYTGEGDPTSTNWTEFTGITLPAGGSNVYEKLEIDIAEATGEASYIAFQFEGGTNSSSISFDLDNIEITTSTGGGNPPPGNSDPGNCDLTGGGTIIISHDFEGCTTDFSVPDGFIEVVVPGSKTDRGWGCRADGTNDSRAVRASAFGGEDGTDNAWLVMDAFDATPYSEISLSFDVQSVFDGPGDLNVLYSLDYSGAGDPTAATWSTLENVASQLPAKGASVFANVVTSPCSISGSSVYIAFQYVGGSNTASSAWSIDNVELRGN